MSSLGMCSSAFNSGNSRDDTLTVPPCTGRGCGNFDIGQDALGHGRRSDDALQFLVESKGVGVHVLVSVRRDFDLVVDSDDVGLIYKA